MIVRDYLNRASVNEPAPAGVEGLEASNAMSLRGSVVSGRVYRRHVKPVVYDEPPKPPPAFTTVRTAEYLRESGKRGAAATAAKRYRIPGMCGAGLHAMTPENTYTYGGRGFCRTCKRVNKNVRDARRRELRDAERAAA